MNEESIFPYVWKAFATGFNDSLNPCGWTTILIFIITLSLIAHSAKRVIYLGGLFVVLSTVTQYVSALGYWDTVYTHQAALNMVRIIYLLIAATFMVLGFLNFSDWWRYRQLSDVQYFRLTTPVFLQSTPSALAMPWYKRLFNNVRLIGLIIVIALCSTFLAANYPQSEYIFVVYSFMMSGGSKHIVTTSFLFYCTGMMLLLVVTWIALWWMAVKGTRNITAVLYYKGILAALLISTGIGLGYHYLI